MELLLFVLGLGLFIAAIVGTVAWRIDNAAYEPYRAYTNKAQLRIVLDREWAEYQKMLAGGMPYLAELNNSRIKLYRRRLRELEALDSGE